MKILKSVEFIGFPTCYIFETYEDDNGNKSFNFIEKDSPLTEGESINDSLQKQYMRILQERFK